MRRQMNRDRSPRMTRETIRFSLALILMTLFALVIIAAIVASETASIALLLRMLVPLVTMVVGYYFKQSRQN